MSQPFKSEAQPIYEFGSYRLDAAERRLERDGEVIPLQPKIFDLLLALVARHGRLLEKDELLRLVWPDAVVEEANLANNISILRKMLRENGERLIETVPKRGYRFVTEVREVAADGAEFAAPLPALDESSINPVPTSAAKRLFSRRQGHKLGVGIVLAALIVLTMGLYYFRTERGAAETPIKTMAVLPPRPLQAGERDEALELGTTSTLITRLSGLRQLIVRPESAVARYAHFEQDPLAAGREQKVDAVLDSRYQRAGDKLRFRLRLLRVADGVTLWADTLDAQAADPFAIEDALSAKVTGALRLTLSSADKELLAKRYTNSAEAWQLYVRGRYLVHTRRIPDTEKAITYFRRAIELDHGFALAHVLLGYSYASLSYFGYPPKEFMPKAKVAYDQALKLDDQLAEVHSYLALYKHYYEWDYQGAEQAHRRALDLNPNSADVRRGYAVFLAFMGRFEQAIQEIRRAAELDPTSPLISRNVAFVLYLGRRCDEALEQLHQAVELNPAAVFLYYWMFKAYEMKGDDQGAFAGYLKQMEVSRAGAEEITQMKTAFAASGWKGCVRRSLDRLLEQEKSGLASHANVAMLYALLGEKEKALARLQKVVDDRDSYTVMFNVDPTWDAYRTDPRFVALVRRVGLAP